MAFSRSLAISTFGSVLLCAIGACGSEEPAKDGDDSADQDAPPAQVVMNEVPPPVAGQAGAATNGMQTAAAGTGGISGHAGSGGNGSGGAAMAAAGAAAAGTGTGGDDAADAAVEDDLFGLFAEPAPDALSCEGLVCFEAADCTSLYPDEAAACKFTSCEDFVCK